MSSPEVKFRKLLFITLGFGVMTTNAKAANVNTHQSCPGMVVGEVLPSSAPAPKKTSNFDESGQYLVTLPKSGTSQCFVYTTPQKIVLSLMVTEQNCREIRSGLLDILKRHYPSEYDAVTRTGAPLMMRESTDSIVMYIFGVAGQPLQTERSDCGLRIFHTKLSETGRLLAAKYPVGTVGTGI